MDKWPSSSKPAFHEGCLLLCEVLCGMLLRVEVARALSVRPRAGVGVTDCSQAHVFTTAGKCLMCVTCQKVTRSSGPLSGTQRVNVNVPAEEQSRMAVRGPWTAGDSVPCAQRGLRLCGLASHPHISCSLALGGGGCMGTVLGESHGGRAQSWSSGAHISAHKPLGGTRGCGCV